MKIRIPKNTSYNGLRFISEGKTTLDPTSVSTEQVKTLTRPEITLLCDELFMGIYRGKPCKMCGRTHIGKQPTVAHHLIPKSSHPHLRYTPENAFELCVRDHDFAELCPESFRSLLKKRFPDRHAWYESNKHHRDYEKLNLVKVFLQLKEQYYDKEEK